jgi:hypothetical protein
MTRTQLAQTQTLYFRVVFVLGSRVVSKIANPRCGELPLKILFLELFAIACGKDAWVQENMQIQNGNIHWNILFTQHVND